MSYSVFPAPAAGSKTMYRRTLTSGTSYTVPAGVTYLNVTLYGGGGGGGGGNGGANGTSSVGHGGQVVSSTLSVTPGSTITYAIGAGGSGGGSSGQNGSSGGTTTFTGATSAAGGNGGTGNTGTGTVGTNYQGANNGGGHTSSAQGAFGKDGGSGKIDIEYWV